jgi:cytochrome b subunit of formate dehydrogenase
MLLFIVTGFALCGQYGLEQWLSTRQALYLHHLLDGPLIVLFLVHAVGSIYLGLRRRRWVKR